MGKRSFGKGLVQEPYEMTDGSEIRLTIAKYYTPSGRCIQRSFANGKDAYVADFEKRFNHDELTKDEYVALDTTRYYTNNHRIVYGGGGIKPDFYIPYDSSVRLSTTLVNILYSADLKTAMWDYILHNKQKLKYKTIAAFDESFNGEDDIIKDYLAQLGPQDRKRVWKEISQPKIYGHFSMYLKAQVARFLFHENGYYAITIKKDNVVNKALDVLGSAEYSQLISRK
jgi:carboxyl-terminal processing protease